MAIPRNLSNLAPGASSTGVLDVTKGGTGLSAPGTVGNVLTSDGTNWTSAAAASGAQPLVLQFNGGDTPPNQLAAGFGII